MVGSLATLASCMFYWHVRSRQWGLVQQSELEAEAALQLDVLEEYHPELYVPLPASPPVHTVSLHLHMHHGIPQTIPPTCGRTSQTCCAACCPTASRPAELKGSTQTDKVRCCPRYPVRASQEEPEGDLGDDGLEGAMREDSGLSSRRGSANRQRATVKVCPLVPNDSDPLPNCSVSRPEAFKCHPRLQACRC